MQFLLTEEEYRALEPKAGADKLREQFARTSQLVAKLTRGSCIHDGDTAPGEDDYCDNCGMAQLDGKNPLRCPFPRNFSK